MPLIRAVGEFPPFLQSRDGFAMLRRSASQLTQEIKWGPNTGIFNTAPIAPPPL